MEKIRLKEFFDTITLIISFHEFDDGHKALQNLKCHLKPNGNFLVVEQEDHLDWVETTAKDVGLKVISRQGLGAWFQHNRFREMYLVEAETL